MNYNNLFPRLLKNIPNLPPRSFCYDSINDINYNKNKFDNSLRCFIPNGKRLLLWFLKHDSNYYSILLEYQSSKVVKCHFKYISFNKILASGNGTMIWVTQIGREMTLNKLIYFKGKYCKLKTVGEQMKELRFLLNSYINNLSHSSFIQLKLPVISNTDSVLSFVGNMNYLVYNAITMENNYNIHIHNFLCVFKISCIDAMSDCYSLSCKDKNGKIFHYQNALINNIESSKFIKNVLNIKHIHYQDVEKSDNEDDDYLENNNAIIGVTMYCIYDKNRKKWKPYKRCKQHTLVDDISKIKTLEEKSSRF